MGKKSNTQLVFSSYDRNFYNENPAQAPIEQPYNNFTLNNPGQNVLQGQIKEIAVTEIEFPYDIANVQPGASGAGNKFIVDIDPSPGSTFQVVTVPTGYYTGTELAAAVTAALITASLPTITCTYSAVSNTFTFANSGSTLYAVYPYFTPDTPPANVFRAWSKKQLLNTMGFQYISANSVYFPLNPTTGTASGTSAPLIWTRYVDICSRSLTQNQFMREGNTSRFTARRDLLCRVYICTNIAVADLGTTGSMTGTRPFIIHRLFPCPKTMAWTTDASVPNVDIQLFDDLGNPLDYAGSGDPRDFQITLNVYENDIEPVGNARYG